METGSNQNSLLLPSQPSYSFSPVPSVYLPQVRTTLPSLSAIPSLEIQIPDIPVETSLPQQPISFVSGPQKEQTQRLSYPIPPQPPSLKPQRSYLAPSSPPSMNSPPMLAVPLMNSPPSLNSLAMYPVPHSPSSANSPPMYAVPLPHSPPSEHISVHDRPSFSPSSYALSSSIGVSVASSSFASVPDSPNSSDSVVVVVVYDSRDAIEALIGRRRRY